MPVLEAVETPSPKEATAGLEALAHAFLAARGGPSATGNVPITAPDDGAQPPPPGIIVLDAGGLIQAFDEQSERLWNRLAADVHATPIGDLLQPEPPAGAGVVTAVARLRGGPDASVLVSRHSVQVGEQRLSVLSVHAQDGGTRATRSELRYQNLVEQIPAVVFTAALDGALYDVYVGPQIETLLGYTQEEWLKSPVLWYQRLHPDDRRILDQEFARGCATGGPFRAECRFIGADGRVVWVHGEARLIKDAQGWPLFLQGVAFDITDAKRAEEVVKASLREKELLLKEIHHRVKNNLQITSSLLRLQVARVSDVTARQTLRESQDRIRSIALVHEMLYRSPDLSRVSFADYVRELLQQLFRSYSADSGRIACQVDIGTVVLGIDRAVPCGLILNELVANAIKHAFPDGRRGSIQVGMTSEDKQVRLVVRDDGVGFPRDLDWKHVQTLGLELVQTLVDQLDGKIDLKVPERGTEFIVSFPAESR